MTTRVATYARLSSSSEESVSIARQLKAGQDYAAARGWTVSGEYIDDGVSATYNRPEDRKGWRALLDDAGAYDVVLVWKVDRLARKVLDFLHADETLREQGAGIVAVEDPVDMTTAQGRAFAQMLAVFAEMEAASISARAKAARNHLVRSGRVVGGTIPYGWRKIENPDGAGYVLAKDFETIGFVEGMAERALSGASVYSIKGWLDEVGAPLPRTSQSNRKRQGWHYMSVERLLRSPLLAGLTAHNPGNRSHARGNEILRDSNGLPVVDPTVAIISLSDRERLLSLLDTRDSPQSAPRASKGATSPLLAGLATCADCEVKMARGTNVGRPVLTCPSCHQTISRNQLDPYVVDKVLTDRSGVRRIHLSETSGVDDQQLAALESAIKETTARMADDDADLPALVEQLADLKVRRTEARNASPVGEVVIRGEWVIDAYRAATDDVGRREILAEQIETLTIHRGKVGRLLDPARVRITYRPEPELRIWHEDTDPEEMYGPH